MSLSQESAVAIVCALIGSAFFWRFLKFLWGRLKWKREKDLIDGIRSVRRVYDNINFLLNYCERSTLFFGHDSGGVPRASSPFYVSALHWAALSKEKFKFEEFQNIPVDSEYISMLLQCREQKFVEVKTADLRDCILKDYYEAEGVKHAMICFVGIRDNKFFFLTVARYEDRPFEDAEITHILFKTQGIANEVMS